MELSRSCEEVEGEHDENRERGDRQEQREAAAFD